MNNSLRVQSGIVAALAVTLATGALAQDTPFREDGWAKLPDGRKWGATGAVDIDRDGNIWVFERCGGATCAGSNVAPIVKLEASGKYLKSFAGEGVVADAAGNVYWAETTGGMTVRKFVRK